MSADEYVCTTVRKYADRAEGQVFCRGSREDCDATADTIFAISIGGPSETPIESSVLVVPSAILDLPAGRAWFIKATARGES